jgi:hypothetical protein
MALLIALALMTGSRGSSGPHLRAAAHVYVFKVGGVTEPEAEMKRSFRSRACGAPAPGRGGERCLEGETDGLHRREGMIRRAGEEVTQLGNAMRSGRWRRFDARVPTTSPAS